MMMMMMWFTFFGCMRYDSGRALFKRGSRCQFKATDLKCTNIHSVDARQGVAQIQTDFLVDFRDV